MITAVVLANLGGADKLDNVEEFLFNLFSDPDIFKLPFGKKGQKIDLKGQNKKNIVNK